MSKPALLDALEPRLLFSATLTADAGPDLSTDEGSAIQVDGSFVDTNPGTPGTFDLLNLTSDSLAESRVAIDGDRVAWNNGGRVMLFDGTTDGSGNPNTIDLSAAAGITSTQVTGVDVGGDRVAYSVVGTGGGVFVYDINTATAQQLTGSATSLGEVKIDGDIVVWQQSSGGVLSSFSFDLGDPSATPQQVASSTDPGGSGATTNPFVDNGVIYWIGVGTGGFTDVFAKDLASSNIFNVSNTASQGDQNIHADDGVVVWNTVPNASMISEAYVFDGRGYNGTGTAPAAVKLISLASGSVRPMVSGTNVVYESFNTSRDRDIFAYNLDTQTNTNITNDGSLNSEQFSSVSGDNAVWEVTIGASRDLVLYDLATGTTTSVSTDGVADFMPVVSGANLAWVSGSGTSGEVVFARGQGNATYSIDWDFGDGTVLTDAGLSESHTYLDDGTYTVTLTVTSSNGDVATDTAIVTVSNLAPVADALTGPAEVVRGQVVGYSGAFTDAGVLDTHTETWTVTDATNTVVATGTGASFDFTPTALGSFTVTYTVTDDDSGVDSSSIALSTSLSIVTADPYDPTKTVLTVGGGDNAEDIKITGDATGLSVSFKDFVTGEIITQAGITADRITVYGGGGDDHIKVFKSAGMTPVDIFGGDGDDMLRGGEADDIIVGGAGDDFIGGNTGRDILIGGEGSDTVIGHQDDDILVAGSYASENDLASLRALMAIWQSTNDYTTRVASVSTMLNDTTVSDDGSYDMLMGLQGQDYFLFTDSQDKTDQRRDELMTDTQIAFLDSEL